MAAPDEHLLLQYEYVDDMLARRGPYREAHLERITAERAAGRVVMAGALGQPPRGGAILFRGVEPAHAEAFAKGDPYVEAGLVTSWRLDPWKLV
jgi:uncharacterized protein YciI